MKTLMSIAGFIIFTYIALILCENAFGVDILGNYRPQNIVNQIINMTKTESDSNIQK